MTPHASPSYRPPAKRSRLSKSTYRVLNVWAQLAERYNKRLDEDDIVDLYSGAIISDRGVLKNGKDYDFGHFAPDASQDDQDQEQEQEDGAQDQDDDLDELDTLPVRRGSGTDGTMASTSELLRAVPPLSATTDADDLDDFLEAEKRRRELLGDEDGEDDMSMEELAALREALHESEEDEERLEIVEPEDAAVSEEEDSEDELSIWQHDEASAVYRIARNESEQDIAEGEQKILESPDSDEEFAALLERPSRVGKRKRTPSPSPSQQSISLSFSQRCISPSPSQRSSSPSPSQRHFSPSPSSSSKRKSPLSLSQRGTSSESTLGNVATFTVCAIIYRSSRLQYPILLQLQQAPVLHLIRRELKFTHLPPPLSTPHNHRNTFSTKPCNNCHMLYPQRCCLTGRLTCLRHR
ncbi:uncharacterized protein EDB91DRAFT_130012 [Suillus paluster]|uniref:uncharacterized protein n=1 Tax=Suillus paluster TaxID=48578 RepID=UPI001B87A575|nr:uncharacterized protein EDB91DRAFT_130012 [Suillus paluster]KAG1745882.1 hypothetical protein EDB91DRAFT_130012 [Suillus paluster]